ncbi:hypothetical protein EBZ38_13970 [bacterium]|jgi:hypothetical protein|nr:hypothetical protein [bacterium]
MAYSITTKDGITIDNIPDDVPPDSPELKARVAEIRAQNQPAQAAPMQQALIQPAPIQQEPSLLQQIRDPFTGELRQTEATRTLPEWTTMPELNSFTFQSALTGLGTMLAGPKEITRVVKTNFPNTEVFQDDSGNYIMRSSINGRDYVIPPGVTMGDIPRVLGGLAAFTPAGRAATVTGATLAGAGTQAGIEATQQMAGGEFDVGETLLAGATGGAGQAISRGISAMREAGKGMFAQPAARPRVEPTVPGAGQPLGAGMAEPLGARPPQAAAPTPPASAQELAEAARRAATPSIVPGRQTRAQQILASEARPDLATQEAASRLGILDFLQPDHITTSQPFRELSQAVKSIPGSQLRAQEIQGLADSSKKINEIIDQAGGSRDYASLGQKIETKLQAEVDRLAQKSDDLFTNTINPSIPLTTEINATNLLDYLQQKSINLGGRENLSPIEKDLLAKLSPRKVKVDGQEVDKLPTYGLLDQLRKDIGESLRGKGPFRDASQGDVKQLYKALSEDQKVVAGQFGVRNALEAANAAVKQRIAVQDDMIALFGKNLHRSMVPLLDGSINALAKGDEKQLIGLLKIVPSDMRQEVVASGLRTAFGKAAGDGAVDFGGYARFYEGLMENKPAFNALMTNLPSATRTQLADLYKVSKGISSATRERITTGRIQAIQDQLFSAESLMSTILQTAQKGAIATGLEMGARAMGVPGAGLSVAVASALTKNKTNMQKAADDLLSSPDFLRSIRAVAQGQNDLGAQLLARSRAFDAYSKAVGLPRTLDGRLQFIISALQTERALSE